jgi:Fic family protein
MKVALAHHRFAWVHPFSNGNGRVVRLLTHALLIKYGFQVATAGRLLNPAAVFCADRNRYYALLSQADNGAEADLEAWCVYVLAGIRDEVRKVNRLADYGHLQAKVLLPAVAHARERQWVTPQEQVVLAHAPRLNANQRTYQIRRLVDSGMLQPVRQGARQYTLGFTHNLLLRGIVKALSDEGFVPPAMDGPSPLEG